MNRSASEFENTISKSLLIRAADNLLLYFITLESATMGCLRGETLTLKSRRETVTVTWKQGSFVGFGGDRSQNYVLCDYITGKGNSVPVYIQGGYDVPQKLIIDSKLQYGTQDNVLFFVYHDKSQTPFQE